MSSSLKFRYFLVFLCACAVLALILGVSFGGTHLPVLEVLARLSNPDSSTASNILWRIRLPRVLMGFVVGALLGIAGAVSQGLFRNPLAEPGLIGVSAGASLAAVSCIIFWPQAPFWLLPLAAFSGGLLATHAAIFIARMAGSQGLTLILAGLAINILAGAGVGLGSYFADINQLRLITFWQLGSLSNASWPKLYVCLGIGLLVAWPLWRQWRFLNALLLGESEAKHLGFAVKKRKQRTILWMALAVAGAVAFCGAIGFIGLIIPHLIRLITGPNHRYVLPLSALAGGTFLVLADMLARSLFAPLELPLGVLTALVGGPVFIWLLISQHRRQA